MKNVVVKPTHEVEGDGVCFVTSPKDPKVKPNLYVKFKKNGRELCFLMKREGKDTGKRYISPGELTKGTFQGEVDWKFAAENFKGPDGKPIVVRPMTEEEIGWASVLFDELIKFDEENEIDGFLYGADEEELFVLKANREYFLRKKAQKKSNKATKIKMQEGLEASKKKIKAAGAINPK